jgi:hypothetical protein
MNFDELWRALAQTDALPVEAIRNSLAHWDELVDRFLAKLRAKASGAKFSDDDDNALFFALYMLAEERETRAYSPLCRILETDGEVGEWLGDAMVDTLSGLLINLYDGDPEPLQRVAGNAEAYEWARCAALLALGYLTRTQGALSGEAMRAWLKDLSATLSDLEFDFSVNWAMTIAALGYSDLAPDVARAISKGLVDDQMYSIKNFHADLNEASTDQGALALFERESAKPFGSTLEAIADLEIGTGEEDIWDWDQEGEPPAILADKSTPFVNPNRDVGRNDPCPCGSGKKYKKCCLGA